MADVVRTCTNCNMVQATGEFCERCGTRLPAVVAATTPVETSAATQGAPTYQAAPAQGTPAPYQNTPQPQYAAPKGPNPFEKLFDLSFQGYVTRGSLRVLWISTLILLAVFFVFSLIFFAIAADKIGAYWCIGIFSTLALMPLLIGWTRVVLELVMTVGKLREEVERKGEAD